MSEDIHVLPIGESPAVISGEGLPLKAKNNEYRANYLIIY